MDQQTFDQQYEEIILTADSREAFELLKSVPQSRLSFGQPALIILKWLAADRLENQEFLELFQNNLWEGFEVDFDFMSCVRKKFLSITVGKRDDFKKELLTAIRNNVQVISPEKYFNFSGQGWPNNIRSWSNDYLVFGGAEPLTNIKILEFFRENKNFNKLNLQQQEKIRKLIHLIEWLKHSAFSLRGTPETLPLFYQGANYGIYEGRIYAAPQEAKKGPAVARPQVSPLTVDVKQKYFKLQTRYKEILGQLLPNGVSQTKGGSHIPEVILDQLNNNLALKDAAAVIGNLENLIQLKALAQLVRSRNFTADFGIFVEAHVGRGFKDELTRLTPEVLGLFLQYLLSGKLKLSAEQSAVVGLHLARALGQSGQKDFMTFAYGDLKTGAFKWREVIGDHGKLRFK